MKYIRHKMTGFYTFPVGVSHKDFALNNYLHRDDIVGAGYISNGHCHDRSVSLGIAAGDCDTEDLRKQMQSEAL